MRYCDALKFSIILFSGSVLKETTQQPLQLNKGDDDDEFEITNLKSKYQGNKNNHYSCFRPIMIIVEHIIAGPKTILNGSAITDVFGDVILRYDFKNAQMNSPITSIDLTALESSFTSSGKLISFFPTHVEPFDSNVNERLIDK
jgi:hypothetical protein